MALERLKEACAGITLIEPSSPDYPAARRIYQNSRDAIPLAIAQPKSAAEVACIITAADKNGVKITVRSGGHQIMGLCMESGALAIDMRYLNSVQVDGDKKTVTIGGGTTHDILAPALSSHGLMTPQGLVGTVGYVGWATLGGYGVFMNRYGMGVDNILGAEVVTWDGRIVEADKELLKGIRGAGGAFGIITSIKAKAYPLGKILVGFLMFDAEHLKLLIQIIQDHISLLPPSLSVGLALFNVGANKKVVRIELVWSSENLDEGFQAIEHFISICPPSLASDVEETGISDLISKIGGLIPPKVYGGNHTASFEKFDDEVLDIITKYIDEMPNDPATIMAFHILSPNSPSTRVEVGEASLFPVRSGHTMMELIGSVVDQTKVDESATWAKEFCNALRATGKALEETYVSLTYPSSRSLKQVYGSKWQEVVALKEKYDPSGIFDLVIPRIRSGMA